MEVGSLSENISELEADSFKNSPKVQRGGFSTSSRIDLVENSYLN